MPEYSTPIISTTDFAYIRFHGSTELYGSCYSPKELEKWAGLIRTAAGNLKTVYIYFNNDSNAFAVNNAMSLRNLLAG
jgi:uncharacterized protein YecE (DUF72 family)